MILAFQKRIEIKIGIRIYEYKNYNPNIEKY